MVLPKFSDLKEFTDINLLDQEIFLLHKNLFDLRMKRSINQMIKPHLFKHTKRRIAQLNFKKELILKFKK